MRCRSLAGVRENFYRLFRLGEQRCARLSNRFNVFEGCAESQRLRDALQNRPPSFATSDDGERADIGGLNERGLCKARDAACGTFAQRVQAWVAEATD